MSTTTPSATPAPRRALIAGCAMMATMMNVLDSTIANVALPYMQGSLNTTLDQTTWVLTSYVIASAIMTAPAGWLAQRYGRKNLFMICIVGFTITSMMCGAAQSLEQMVLFRVLQGITGAAMVPLSQATMLDIFPFEQRAQAMAIFGIGVMVGPIMGPTLGGYLTETLSWRWVFYVNLPFGIIALTGLALFMPKTPIKPELRFDWTGFAVLTLAIGMLQLMLDRGQGEDWFQSPEIIAQAVLGALGFYLFLVHMFTAEKPFIPPAIFRDRNFTGALVLMFFTMAILLSSSALLAPYLQNLSGYPVSETGLLLAPRGMGTICAMLIAGRLGTRVDQRLMIGFGLLLLGWALRDMSTWTPDLPIPKLVTSMVIQGFCMGCIFNPLTVLAFTTLPAQFRGDAAALQALVRNLGAAAGIAVTSFMLVSGMQASHAGLAATVTPYARPLLESPRAAHLLDPTTTQGAARLNNAISREALIIAYNNDFRLLSFLTFPSLAMLLLMRRSRPPATVAA
ncbi:MAG: DHA2 family efflux MFS transporter permease subunit [Acetobacteraceae bacterium]|nr:DHA2 family efflux MFS transporter permease subunit [Acetobacteraceae bacterium]